jgi:two-component system, LytTR family, sensor histidine kinase AlgZ
MHPLLVSRTRFLLYLAVWIPITGFFSLMLRLATGISWLETVCVTIPLCLVYAMLCLGPWYSCRDLPKKPIKIASILLNHVIAALVAASLWTFMGRVLVGNLMRYFPSLGARLHPQLLGLFELGVLLYLLSVALHFVMFSIQSQRESESREQEARTLAREAELRALKAQINPHFLFNSLNSISALATSDGKRAREMCIRLSEFLRSTLSLGEKENIALEDEFGLAAAYLSVEQIRFGSKLKVEQDVNVHCAQCTVPPLVLQPLVENAVKHGIAGLLEGGTIRLHAECVDHFLRLRVENEFDPEQPPARKSGIGLANVRNRLKARFQEQARLDTSSRGNCWTSEVILPCPTHANGNGNGNGNGAIRA